MPQQPSPAQDYRYNGKERLPGSEIYAYGFRHYDPVVGRFLGVDPISDRFAWASVYNYAENEPVGHIDLWGLQGVKSTEIQKGKEITVIAADIHIAIGMGGFSEKQVAKLSKTLNKAFDKKVDGRQVDVRFKVFTYDAGSVSLDDKASKIRTASSIKTADPDPIIPSMNRISVTAAVVGLDALPSGDQGNTKINRITISESANDYLHTVTHEVGHFLLLGSSDQPKDDLEHEKAGGIFKYEVRDPSGAVIESTQGVSKDNVRKIINNVPRKKE